MAAPARPAPAPRISTNSLPTIPTRFFQPTRIRSYIFRLPLFTRLILLAIIAFWLLGFQTVWSVTKWGWLEPKEVNFGTLYRLNTFVLVHTGFWHMLVDTICLVPLLERFEAEFGTLTSIALFLGRKFHHLQRGEKDTDAMAEGLC
jgi:glycosylphosphatidylinositol transamidase